MHRYRCVQLMLFWYQDRGIWLFSQSLVSVATSTGSDRTICMKYIVPVTFIYLHESGTRLIILFCCTGTWIRNFPYKTNSNLIWANNLLILFLDIPVPEVGFTLELSQELKVEMSTQDFCCYSQPSTPPGPHLLASPTSPPQLPVVPVKRSRLSLNKSRKAAPVPADAGCSRSSSSSSQPHDIPSQGKLFLSVLEFLYFMLDLDPILHFLVKTRKTNVV